MATLKRNGIEFCRWEEILPLENGTFLKRTFSAGTHGYVLEKAAYFQEWTCKTRLTEVFTWRRRWSFREAPGRPLIKDTARQVAMLKPLLERREGRLIDQQGELRILHACQALQETLNLFSQTF